MKLIITVTEQLLNTEFTIGKHTSQSYIKLSFWYHFCPITYSPFLDGAVLSSQYKKIDQKGYSNFELRLHKSSSKKSTSANKIIVLMNSTLFVIAVGVY